MLVSVVRARIPGVQPTHAWHFPSSCSSCLRVTPSRPSPSPGARDSSFTQRAKEPNPVFSPPTPSPEGPGAHTPPPPASPRPTLPFFVAFVPSCLRVTPSPFRQRHQLPDSQEKRGQENIPPVPAGKNIRGPRGTGQEDACSQRAAERHLARCRSVRRAAMRAGVPATSACTPGRFHPPAESSGDRSHRLPCSRCSSARSRPAGHPAVRTQPPGRGARRARRPQA
jgi:hypothetical protein